MKEGIYEYYPNGCLKHVITVHPNGKLKYKLIFYSNENKCHEQYFDEEGHYHNNCGPDYQGWYENGYLCGISFIIHGKYHNISNSAVIWYFQNGKIENKNYCINDRYFSDKLNWQNKIKNI